MLKKLNCSFFGVMTSFTKYLKTQLKSHKITVVSKIIDIEKLDKKTEVLGVFVDSKVDKEVFQNLPNLKLIVTMSTGFDHIDLAEAKKRKIPVCNVPTYGENTVAEHTISLILALSRQLFHSIDRVKEGNYDYHGLRGFDIKGKTIGVIGTGHIGQHVIKRLAGFEAEIIAFDLFPKPELETDFNFRYVKKLDELLKKSDIITLHLPLFPETYHLINKKNIKKIKKGAYIINTARGGLVEPEALVWGLESGRIAGAGLDVLEDEQIAKDPSNIFYSETGERGGLSMNMIKDEKVIKNSLLNNMLIDHPNVIITPHNAFNSTEAIERIINTTAENIDSFANGKVINDVTKKK
ncbi:MAG: NAD(P)-binding domain-containing protein [Candidatus Magasanikbacteria bacterium]|nr:NAD(P)-binding domain-containing protein [Candidatus Magasanikbacteria bacterium]